MFWPSSQGGCSGRFYCFCAFVGVWHLFVIQFPQFVIIFHPKNVLPTHPLFNFLSYSYSMSSPKMEGNDLAPSSDLLHQGLSTFSSKVVIFPRLQVHPATTIDRFYTSEREKKNGILKTKKSVVFFFSRKQPTRCLQKTVILQKQEPSQS